MQTSQPNILLIFVDNQPADMMGCSGNEEIHTRNLDALAVLERMVDEYITACADPKWDLWRGGRVKSNSTRPFLWQDVWGENWSPTF